MNNDVQHIEKVKQKLDQLDSEVTTFLTAIHEIKEMKSSVGVIHDRLKNHEGEIENQKKELKELLSSAQNAVKTTEEQTKEMSRGLEKKADTLISEIKTGISQIGTVWEKGRDMMKEQQKDTMENLSDNYEELKNFCETLKTMVDTQEEKMNKLNRDFLSASGFYDKINASLAEMKNALQEFQKKPYEAENKLKKMEEHFELVINEQHVRQKNFNFVLLMILTATIAFSVVAFYLR